MVQELGCLHVIIAQHRLGSYNRHLRKPRGCCRKPSEQRVHCYKTFTANGSGLKKHTCKAGDLLRLNMCVASDHI